MSTSTSIGAIPEPTVRASLANGFQVFIDDIVPLVIVGTVVVIVGAACGSLVLVGEFGQILSIASYFLIAGPLGLGMSFVCLRAVRSGRVNFEHLFAIFNRYWALLVANALMTMILPGALAILVVPGVAFFCATRFVPFLLFEDELGGAEAIRESIRLSRSCFWQLLGICAVGAATVSAVAMLVTHLGGLSIVAMVPVLIWWNLSLASLYHSLVRPPEGWVVEDEEDLEQVRADED